MIWSQKNRYGITVPVLQHVKIVTSNVKAYQFAQYQKPPLCKGRWIAVGETEGLCRRILRIRIDSRKKSNIVLHQPLSHFVFSTQNDSSPYTGEP